MRQPCNGTQLLSQSLSLSLSVTTVAPLEMMQGSGIIIILSSEILSTITSCTSSSGRSVTQKILYVPVILILLFFNSRLSPSKEFLITEMHVNWKRLFLISLFEKWKRRMEKTWLISLQRVYLGWRRIVAGLARIRPPADPHFAARRAPRCGAKVRPLFREQSRRRDRLPCTSHYR